MNKNKLKVINLFGPPGVGKSATRSGIFWLMKCHHISVEEVSEYAKYLVLTGRTWQLKDDQLYLLAKQHHKQLILHGRYEFAVTDSPLSLCDFYAPPDYFPDFRTLVKQAEDRFENINFYLTRDLSTGFEQEGRVHDLEAATLLDEQMRQYLHERSIKYTEVPLDLLTPWRIVEQLCPGVVRHPKF